MALSRALPARTHRAGGRALERALADGCRRNGRAAAGVAWEDRLVAAHPNAPGDPSDRWVLLRRCAAVAAVIGGAAWLVKAAVTLATGDEPAAAFAIGGVLFPFALLGMWSIVRTVDGRAGRVGGALAAAAAVSVVLAAVVRALGGAGVEPREDEITVLTPFLVMAGFGTFAALLALGLAVRRAGALAPGWRSLPWAMGVAVVPLLIVGGALETLNERLLEIPIALLGLGWLALGAALWNVAEHHPPETNTRASA